MAIKNIHQKDEIRILSIGGAEDFFEEFDATVIYYINNPLATGKNSSTSDPITSIKKPIIKTSNV